MALAADADGVIYEGAFGRVGPQVDTPMRLDAVFRIASMTEAVTALLMAQILPMDDLQITETLERYEQALYTGRP